jgi:hypothetical protein
MENNDYILGSLFRKYKEDPVFFVEHALGHKTWSKQREILKSIAENEKTAVKACHGSSKTYTAAEAVAWFLNCFDNSKVVTTAPTYTQVAKLLWSEINKSYLTSRFILIGECLTTEIKTDSPDHFAIGFSTDQPARAEGWHAPAILFIFDEAKGIAPWLWDSVESLLTGGFCRWLVISTTDGVQVGDNFYNLFKRENSGWNRIEISAYDTPYSTGENFRGIKIPDPSHPERFEREEIKPEDIVIQVAGPKYIYDRKKEWGEDSVLFKTNVLGQIVDQSADTIIKLSQVMKMFGNWNVPAFETYGKEEIGVDVARGGGDDTIFRKRKGMKVIDKRIIPSKEMPPQAKLVFLANELEHFAGFNKEVGIKIDDTGVGGGLTDIMEARNYNIIPINFQATAKEPDKYPNAISEMWFQASRIMDKIACQEDERLKTELVNRKWSIDKKGRRVVESKDDYKKRGFRSPDDADAFLLCFYNPDELHGEVSVAEETTEEEVEIPRMPLELMKLHSEENAKRYVELSKQGLTMEQIAKEMMVDGQLLRRWIQREREYIQSVVSGTESDFMVID